MYTPRTSSYIDNAWPLLRDFGYGRDEIAQVVRDCDYDDQLINERISDMAIEGASGKGWKKVGHAAKVAQNRGGNPARNRKPAGKKVDETQRKQDRQISDPRGPRKQEPEFRQTNAPFGKPPRQNDLAKPQAAAEPAARVPVADSEPRGINEGPKATQDSSSSYKKGTTALNGDTADTPPTRRVFTWASKLKSSNPTNMPPVFQDSGERRPKSPESSDNDKSSQLPPSKAEQTQRPSREAYSWAARARGVKAPEEEGQAETSAANDVDPSRDSPDEEKAEVPAKCIDAPAAGSGPEDSLSGSRRSDQDSRHIAGGEEDRGSSTAAAGAAAAASPVEQLGLAYTSTQQRAGLVEPQPQAQQPPHIPAQAPAAAPVLHHQPAAAIPPSQPQPPQTAAHPAPHQYQQYVGLTQHHQAQQQQQQQNVAQARAYEHYAQPPPPPPYQYQQHPYPAAYRMPNYYDYDFGRARAAPAAGVAHHPTATASYPEYYMGYPFRMPEETNVYGADMRAYGGAGQTRPDQAGGPAAAYPYYYAYDHRRYEYVDNASAAQLGPSASSGRDYRDYSRPVDTAAAAASAYQQKPPTSAPGQAGGYARPDPFRREGFYGSPPVYMAAAAAAAAAEQQASAGLDHSQLYQQQFQQPQQQQHQQQQQQPSMPGYLYNSASGGYFAHYSTGGTNDRRSRY